MFIVAGALAVISAGLFALAAFMSPWDNRGAGRLITLGVATAFVLIRFIVLVVAG